MSVNEVVGQNERKDMYFSSNDRIANTVSLSYKRLILFEYFYIEILNCSCSC